MPSTDSNTTPEDLVSDNSLTEATGAISRIVSSAVKSYNCIFDGGWLAVLLDNSLLWNEQVQLKFRHVASRFITRISQENLEPCTRLMKYVELRHIDNVTGYLGIKDVDEQFIYVSTGMEHFGVDSTKLINPESDLISLN